MPAAKGQKPVAIFLYRNGNDCDRFDGHISAAGLDGSNLVDHLKAFDNLAKHRVVTVQMRGATHSLVSLTLAGAEHLAHTALKHVQSAVVIHLALHDVELRATGSLLGIHLVRLASSSQGAFLVEVVVLELGRDPITWVEATVLVLSALDHEILDDAVERRAVVPAFVHQLDEVVTMLGRVVIQFGLNSAHAGLDDNDGFFLCSLLCLAGQTDQYQCCDNQFFHFIVVLFFYD